MHHRHFWNKPTKINGTIHTRYEQSWCGRPVEPSVGTHTPQVSGLTVPEEHYWVGKHLEMFRLILSGILHTIICPKSHQTYTYWWTVGYIITWAICLLLDNKSQHGVTYFSKCSDEIPKVFLVYIDIFLTNPWPRYQKKKVFYRFHTLPGDQKSMTFFMTFKDLSPNL